MVIAIIILLLVIIFSVAVVKWRAAASTDVGSISPNQSAPSSTVVPLSSLPVVSQTYTAPVPYTPTSVAPDTPVAISTTAPSVPVTAKAVPSTPATISVGSVSIPAPSPVPPTPTITEPAPSLSNVMLMPSSNVVPLPSSIASPSAVTSTVPAVSIPAVSIPAVSVPAVSIPASTVQVSTVPTVSIPTSSTTTSASAGVAPIVNVAAYEGKAIKCATLPAIYKVEKGVKRKYPDYNTYVAMGQPTFITLTCAQVDSIPLGSPYPSVVSASQYEGKVIKCSTLPAIYKVENGVKRKYPDYNTYVAMGQPTFINLTCAQINAIPTGIPFTPIVV